MEVFCQSVGLLTCLPVWLSIYQSFSLSPSVFMSFSLLTCLLILLSCVFVDLSSVFVCVCLSVSVYVCRYSSSDLFHLFFVSFLCKLSFLSSDLLSYLLLNFQRGFSSRQLASRVCEFLQVKPDKWLLQGYIYIRRRDKWGYLGMAIRQNLL